MARVGEELPVFPDGSLLSCRSVAAQDPPWWFIVGSEPEPDGSEIDDYGGGLWFPGGAIATGEFAIDEAGNVWDRTDPANACVGLPITQMAAELVGEVDAWRRQRRIAEKQWPPWM